ncbi:MAG: hypothetical protein WC374_09245 [Phycisphaerae bacterium]|jgi:hypothetical protein
MERILKSSDFEMAGKVQLPGFAANGSPSMKTAAVSSPAQAAVVENNSEFALIEVTCPCGQKTVIKCEYVQ